MIVFAHTKFGLGRIQGSGVKRGADSAPPSLSEFFKSRSRYGYGCEQLQARDTNNLIITRGPMGHILDTDIRYFRATRVEINTAAQ